MFVQWMSFVCFFVAAVIHVIFFVVESILFQRPDGYSYFKMPEQDHKAAKVWAFNQGFYNLFLAIGTFVGLLMIFQKKIMLAGVLVSFCGMSMLGAGIVLWFSAPHLRRGAYVQIIPPLLGFFFLFFHVARF